MLEYCLQHIFLVFAGSLLLESKKEDDCTIDRCQEVKALYFNNEYDDMSVMLVMVHEEG